MADISVQTQSQSRQAASPNRGRRRPRGRFGKGAKAKDPAATGSTLDSTAQMTDRIDVDTPSAADVSSSQTEAQEDDDQDLCWICAEPVKYYAVSQCNHRTCHVCALRLRALYKKLDCTFCKVRVTSIQFV